MSGQIIQVSEDFWNFRGSFRIGGVIDVGTQASLVQLASGKFVFLDSYTLGVRARQKVAELTDDGANIEAILNLHPFHTIHVTHMHEQYPHASLYGTQRHHARFPNLPWAKLRTEDIKLHQRYADDFDFSVPGGVDFVSADENVHFSSVLALHRYSMTIHSDDTIMYLHLPLPMRLAGLGDSVSFHPTLAKALERRAGAADDFRDWAEELIDCWQDAENLCAAHTASLLARDNNGASIYERLGKALQKVGGTLRSHKRKHG
ncbi:MAG: hypothetical protein HKN70_02810 [Gammaproteobacteria bacterium]|nr:hypothetical protein [Gammaproteobacteria bacterium]